MYRLLGIFLLLLSPRSDALFSKLEISMVATHLENYIEYNNSGALDFLMKDLSLAAGIDHQYHVISYARSRRSFIREEIHCILPASSFPKLLTSRKVIQSQPLIRKQFYIYTAINTPMISALSDIDNKVIGVVKNALPNYKTLLGQHHLKVIEVSNFKTMLEMLNKGRLDAIIHDSASIETVLSQKQRNNLHHDSMLNFLFDEIKITCHQSDETELYIDNINRAMQSFKVKSLNDYLAKAGNSSK